MEKEQLKSLLTNYATKTIAIEQSIGATVKRIKMLESSIPTLMIWKKWKNENRIPKINIDELIDQQIELKRKRKLNQSEEKIKFLEEFKSIITPPSEPNQGDALSNKIDCLRRLQRYIIQEKMIKKKIKELEEKQVVYRSALEQLANPIKSPLCEKKKNINPFFKEQIPKPCVCESCSCQCCLGLKQEKTPEIKTSDTYVGPDMISSHKESIKEIKTTESEKLVKESDLEKSVSIIKSVDHEEIEQPPMEQNIGDTHLEELIDLNENEEMKSEKLLTSETFELEQVLEESNWDETVQNEQGLDMNLQNVADKLKTTIKSLQSNYMNIDCRLIETLKQISKFISMTAQSLPEKEIGENEIDKSLYKCAAMQALNTKINQETIVNNNITEDEVPMEYEDKGIDVMSIEENLQEETENLVIDKENSEPMLNVMESKSESGCEPTIVEVDSMICKCLSKDVCPGRNLDMQTVIKKDPSVLSGFVTFLNELKEQKKKFEKVSEVKCLCNICNCEPCTNEISRPDIVLTDQQRQMYEVCDNCDCDVCICNIVCQQNVLSSLVKTIPCSNSDYVFVETGDFKEHVEEILEENVKIVQEENVEIVQEENVEIIQEENVETVQEKETQHNIVENERGIINIEKTGDEIKHKWKNMADKDITYEDLLEMRCTCEICSCSKCPDKMSKEASSELYKTEEHENKHIVQEVEVIKKNELNETISIVEESGHITEKASIAHEENLETLSNSNKKSSQTDKEQVIYQEEPVEQEPLLEQENINEQEITVEQEEIMEQEVLEPSVPQKPSLISNFSEIYSNLMERKGMFEKKPEVKCYCHICKCSTCLNHIPEPEIDITDLQQQIYEPCDLCECENPCVCNIICQRNILVNIAKNIPCTSSDILCPDDLKSLTESISLISTSSCKPIEPCSCGETGSCHCLCKACPCSQCKMYVQKLNLPCDCSTPCQCIYCPDCVCQCSPCDCKLCPDIKRSSVSTIIPIRDNYLSDPVFVSCGCGTRN